MVTPQQQLKHKARLRVLREAGGDLEVVATEAEAEVGARVKPGDKGVVRIKDKLWMPRLLSPHNHLLLLRRRHTEGTPQGSPQGSPQGRQLRTEAGEAGEEVHVMGGKEHRPRYLQDHLVVELLAVI